MGAGIAWKTKRRRIYARLKTVERKLRAKGIPCQYTHLEVRGKLFVVYFAGAGPASNGESCAWLVLRFNPNQQPCAVKKQAGDIDFTNFHTRDIAEHSKGGWDAGVQRGLDTLHGPPPTKWQWMSNVHGGMGWFSEEEKKAHEGTAEFTDGYWRLVPPEEVATFLASVGRLAYEQS